MTAPLRRLLPVLLVSVVAAACGGSTKSPAAPETAGTEATPTPSPSPTPATGATISGLVSSGAASSMAGAVPMGAFGLAGVSVSVSGTSLSAMTDAGGHFRLSGVPPGLVRLQFSGGVNGEVEIQDVGEQESIEIEVHASGGEVEIESEERNNGGESQLEGKIASVNAGAHTFRIGDTGVVVPSSASITDGFRALDFSDLVVGARVHVKGSKSGSTITASRIEVQQSTLDKVNTSGTVANLGGACPNRTFRIGSQRVAVNDSTIFVHGGCGDLVNGMDVDVKGLRRPDGSILGTQVKLPNGHD